MTTPPILHSASTIRSDPDLAATITSFVNSSYRYIHASVALRWDANSMGGDRLPTPTAIHTTLGPDGIFAVIYSDEDKTTPLACAAIKRWTHDLEGHSSPDEAGWEIVTVTTREGYMRRGLAGKCVDALMEEVLRQAKESGSGSGGEEKVRVWVRNHARTQQFDAVSLHQTDGVS
jgi:GNAT superfamily N-acetyltransferase